MASPRQPLPGSATATGDDSTSSAPAARGLPESNGASIGSTRDELGDARGLPESNTLWDDSRDPAARSLLETTGTAGLCWEPLQLFAHFFLGLLGTQAEERLPGLAGPLGGDPEAVTEAEAEAWPEVALEGAAGPCLLGLLHGMVELD